MRILGGRLRGRTVRAPKGQKTRPVLARIREAYFNILADRIRDARIADLFAGSGAIGLEALSRGARSADFYESGAALKTLTRNIADLQVQSESAVHRRPLPSALDPGPAWDLVFVDPPWTEDLGPSTLAALLRSGRVQPESLIFLRERHGQQGTEGEWAERGYAITDQRQYGDSVVLIMQTLLNETVSG
ncbi:MAG: 16S rRNA (guanine(966)-N(2))-methyltransferase RsmD [Myxococcota bacterium]|nr:16S rRNA (guanine(966)-N(2))-methyltransferase RsmD [Myxococcota bacterium]MEE2780314.1 16S rRNA (guanine(966)-N(2))-methyltransferase RsmD [Myxococcota bacterium]